jgi:hypothetical protein
MNKQNVMQWAIQFSITIYENKCGKTKNFCFKRKWKLYDHLASSILTTIAPRVPQFTPLAVGKVLKSATGMPMISWLYLHPQCIGKYNHVNYVPPAKEYEADGATAMT